MNFSDKIIGSSNTSIITFLDLIIATREVSESIRIVAVNLCRSPLSVSNESPWAFHLNAVLSCRLSFFQGRSAARVKLLYSFEFLEPRGPLSFIPRSKDLLNEHLWTCCTHTQSSPKLPRGPFHLGAKSSRRLRISSKIQRYHFTAALDFTLCVLDLNQRIPAYLLKLKSQRLDLRLDLPTREAHNSSESHASEPTSTLTIVTTSVQFALWPAIVRIGRLWSLYSRSKLVRMRMVHLNCGQ